MGKKFNPYKLPPFVLTLRNVCRQFIIPVSVFQGIRTLLFPTPFDLLLLATLIFLAAALHMEWI